MKAPVPFRLNGRPASLDTDDSRKLLWVLRTDLGLTGAKFGCGAGICGACTVLVDGETVRSCITPLSEVRNREVTTIEGLAHDGALHPLQQAFLEHDGFQCGYCTPGMILTASSFSTRIRRPAARRSPSGWSTTSAGAARTPGFSMPSKPWRGRKEASREPGTEP